MVAAWTYLLISLVVVSTARAAICKHRDDVKHAVHRVHLEPEEHIANRVANQPIRFSVYYDNSIPRLSAGVRKRVQAIMQKLTTFLSQTLQVKPVGVPILLDQQCTTSSKTINGRLYCAATCAANTMCGQVVVPARDLQACRQCNGGKLVSSCVQRGINGTGVNNTDYIFYVSAVSTYCAAKVIAYATYCQTESSLDRPIAGNINFCSSVFGSVNDDDILNAVKHKAQHALGFSKGLFPFWRDQNGNPRTRRDPTTNLPPYVNGAYQYSNTTVMRLTYNNWLVRTERIMNHSVTLLITPNVLATARIYFNCSSLIGVELENQGGTHTAISHWEKRILGNELMTGDLSFNPLFSVLTLAALQDTGWYQVNYSMAQPLVWGKNAGCLFAAGSCGGYIKSQLNLSGSMDPFCNMQSTMLGCTIGREAVSLCNMVKYFSPLPKDYQYFSSLGRNYGGGDKLADYCPFQNIGLYPNTVCSNATNNPSGINYLGETYGQSSACVLHGSEGWTVNNSMNNYSPRLSGAGCYQYSYMNNILQIGVLGTKYPCHTAGQQINVSVTVKDFTYKGSLLCASFYQLSGGTDFNQCLAQNGGCSQMCTNTIGGFACSCMAGYTLGADSKSCNDINECATNNGGCSQTCNNTIGSFVCSCMVGYALGADSRSCNDINECATNNGGCSQTCNNTIGSFVCSCKAGYTLGADSRSCNDINECATNNGGCSQTCKNTIGSYECLCLVGYTLNADSRSCNDINDCAINNGGCSQTCNSTIGRFFCTCMAGYTLGADNKTCNVTAIAPLVEDVGARVTGGIIMAVIIAVLVMVGVVIGVLVISARRKAMRSQTRNFTGPVNDIDNEQHYSLLEINGCNENLEAETRTEPEEVPPQIEVSAAIPVALATLTQEISTVSFRDHVQTSRKPATPDNLM